MVYSFSCDSNWFVSESYTAFPAKFAILFSHGVKIFSYKFNIRRNHDLFIHNNVYIVCINRLKSVKRKFTQLGNFCLKRESENIIRIAEMKAPFVIICQYFLMLINKTGYPGIRRAWGRSEIPRIRDRYDRLKVNVWFQAAISSDISHVFLFEKKTGAMMSDKVSRK